MSTAPIDFYFDFSSPYGFIAAEVIEAVAERHQRQVTWRPILIGAAFKITNAQPLLGQPLKGDYALRDLARSAAYMGVPWSGLPSPFPFLATAPSRAFYWLTDRDPAAAKRLARALLRAAFVEQQDISSPAIVKTTAMTEGLDADAVGSALQDPAIKDRLRAEVDTALDAGIFGSPYFIIDGEPFWGTDRLPQMEKWLETGGW